MNMPAPMSKASYANCTDELHKVFTEEANNCLSEAATETASKCPLSEDGQFSQCTVTVDGTWQTRGYSSLNGIVVCLAQESGKCIDYEVLTKYCQACKRWEGRDQTSPQFQEWKASHICPVNHQGSSSSMETAGALTIFQRSQDLHSLQYTTYLGDGDSSAFTSIQEASPYGPNVTINKLECVGHVQKRVGSRLRKLLQDNKGIKLSDGKKINGKGRLTAAIINKLQNYFGLSIRQNTSALYPMKKAVMATLFHNSCLEDATRHQFCPKGAESWCKWRRQEASGIAPAFKPKLSIPVAIYEKVLPVFRDLSKDDLLKKCLHGKTQNANESFNGLIWQKCPKTIFSGRKTVEIAAASAVLHFNAGPIGIINVLKRLGVQKGYFTEAGSDKKSRKRKKSMERKNAEIFKKRRKYLRARKKGWQDNEVEQEGETYAAGKF